MVNKKIKVSVIIISWNTKELLRRCIQTVTPALQTLHSELIVVDNGSNDGSQMMVKSMIGETSAECRVKSAGKKGNGSKLRTLNSELKLIENRENLGFGAANNQAIEVSRGDFLLLLNSDTLVKKDAIEKMAQFLELHPEAGVVGCRLLNQDGSKQPSAGPFPNLKIALVMLFAEHWLGSKLIRFSFDQSRQTDWVMGAALMVRKKVIDKAGQMDESIFMYMDEVEWCYRIKKAGFQVWYTPEAEIVHLGGGSSKTGRQDPIINIYKGLIYFYQKHFPGWKKQILILMLKLKAISAITLGKITRSSYLKETYAKALRVVS